MHFTCKKPASQGAGQSGQNRAFAGFGRCHSNPKGLEFGWCRSLQLRRPTLTNNESDLAMADVLIPAPDAAGYFHFLYRTTDPLDGRWYGGKRSTRKHPAADRYLGSGNWVKAHPARRRLQREIVSFHASSADVFAAEGKWITWSVVNDDPLCMNLRDGGEGVTVEAALLRYTDPVQHANSTAMLRRITSDPVVQAKMSASALLRFEDPEELAMQAAHMRRITSDPVLLAKARVSRETPEWLANVTAGNQDKGIDPAFRAKVKAGMLRAAADPAYQAARAMINAEQRGKKQTPEHAAKAAAGREAGRAARRAAKGTAR